MGKIERQLISRLKRAAGEWRRTAVQNMGTPNNGGKNPGAPGAYPNRGTRQGGGHLRRNINAGDVDRRRMVIQVGTNVKYGKFLEEGTKKMAARPWVTLTNQKTRAKIARIMRKPLR